MGHTCRLCLTSGTTRIQSADPQCCLICGPPSRDSQGLTYTDAPHAEPEAWACMQSDSTATKLPGGESLDELRERLTAAVLDVARSYAGGACGG